MAERASALIRRASLHERSVQKVATQDDASQRRRRAQGARSSASGVEHLAVDSRVWKIARQLSDGDASRIQVIGPECVIVHNRRAP